VNAIETIFLYIIKEVINKPQLVRRCGAYFRCIWLTAPTGIVYLKLQVVNICSVKETIDDIELGSDCRQRHLARGLRDGPAGVRGILVERRHMNAELVRR
jgi:hypothetical protein